MGKPKKNTKIFIEEAIKIHGNKYDYSKVVYNGNKEKVCIICPEHGEFWMRPNNHISGKQECPECGKRKISESKFFNTESFIEKAQKVHGSKYDYSKVNYTGIFNKVTIICPIHGEFEQSPNHHLRNHGCPKCAGVKKLTTEEFIEKANEKHKGKYRYGKSLYTLNINKITITCPIHGDFQQLPYDHVAGHGCPICGNTTSHSEDEIFKYIESLIGEGLVERHNRKVLDGLEIDIFIPSMNFGIEYNGLYWHSELNGKDKHYHLNKTELSRDKGIKLLQIFEDEYQTNKEIVLSKIKHILKKGDEEKIYARKCVINEISNSESKKFLEKNHIQGFVQSSKYYGCFYNEKLIGVMNFLEEKKGYWNLTRFATDINYSCIGVGGKLFKHFLNEHPEFVEIKSFADRRWTLDETENVYTKLGFELVETKAPEYRYFNKDVDPYRRFHKFGFRKQLLSKKYDLPLEMTELEMATELGYTRIWDCGLFKYVYYNNK